MFERFTERARQVVVLAQEEARMLKHNYIGTEHLLLGLLREEEGVAAHVLGGVGVTPEKVRAEVVKVVGQGEEVSSGQIPFTPRAKKMLELALREALHLGHNYIGTEHILLGLVRESEGLAVKILTGMDTSTVDVREAVISTLMGGRPPDAPSPAPPEVPGFAVVPPDVVRAVSAAKLALAVDPAGENEDLARFFDEVAPGWRAIPGR